MNKVPTERKWYLCPSCGAKVLIYDNTAECRGVFTTCSRGCRKEIEVVIENGRQILPSAPAHHSSR